MNKSIITKKSTKPGKTVAIVAGIHGNEQIGLLLFERIIEQIDPVEGTVHFIYGNPNAIKKNVRFTETNLNRNFFRENNNSSYEEMRAHELMNIFDKCDAVLDLHAYNEPDLERAVFAICEERSLEVVHTLPISTVLLGFNKIQRGSTNGYMEERGKIGIVLELGSVANPEKHIDLAGMCVFAFLAHFGLILDVKSEYLEQQYFSVASVHRKNNEQFSFSKMYKSFNKISQGEVVAHDGIFEVSCSKEAYILFPRVETHIGGEAFWLIRESMADSLPYPHQQLQSEGRTLTIAF